MRLPFALALTLGLAFAPPLLAIAPTPAAAAPATEQREELPGPSLARLPAGKTLSTHRAPRGGAALLLRDEGEQGDFVWRSVYVQQGGRYRLLDTCQSIARVSWSADGKQVSFTMEAATGPDVSTTSRVRHGLGTAHLARQVLSTRSVQSAM